MLLSFAIGALLASAGWNAGRAVRWFKERRVTKQQQAIADLRSTQLANTKFTSAWKRHTSYKDNGRLCNQSCFYCTQEAK